MKKKIRVLVVDDSAFMRKVITDLLQVDERIQVIATARNGKDAIEKIAKHTPDVMTLDVEMPVMNGLDTVKRVMETMPLPIVMVSSTTREGETNTFQAIDDGAVDFIAKPSGPISLDLHKIQDDLIEKVISAAGIQLTKMMNDNRAKQPLVQDNHLLCLTKSHAAKSTSLANKIIAIGTSTGGPKALQQVLTNLPKNLNAPLLVVQHMPAGFTQSLANRLNGMSELFVKEAEDGEVVKKGVAYIAPGDYHLTVQKMGLSLVIKLDQSPPQNGHRPSVDVMFESLCSLTNYTKVAVIMTGMGSDGTEGLLRLKQSGNCYAVSESEETAIVYGMPKAAANTNQVDEIVPLTGVAEAIVRHCLV
ncbi:protein-glutamate methylesterase/protein-glutamine glutaminase [Desertibacillus haloalkaliphilus]|uniref:protein-glutamate methylesterase/protein-glutamine glutaminase n=1 Tax=Desertibacillus haloalkaliphilus TaxID=1328930 RepID=UPI001C270F46|nr:chemotaxis response regulator protein-glutamate methylesterase [Desertibacillus haloalkaliphilus]MBU8906992.1 chemotaxis response regulator protein-glutamate methylesterase [Desertibacillus haloalkaliphilus]